MPQMPGGPSDVAAADADTIEICNVIRGHLESQVGSNFSEYVPVEVRKQVVAGTNFFVKIHVGGGDHVHVRIFRPLPPNHTSPQVHSFQAGKSVGDSLEYF